MVLEKCTKSHDGEHLCQVLLNSSINEGVMDQTCCFRPTYPQSVTFDLAKWFLCTALHFINVHAYQVTIHFILRRNDNAVNGQDNEVCMK